MLIEEANVPRKQQHQDLVGRYIYFNPLRKIFDSLKNRVKKKCDLCCYLLQRQSNRKFLMKYFEVFEDDALRFFSGRRDFVEVDVENVGINSRHG